MNPENYPDKYYDELAEKAAGEDEYDSLDDPEDIMDEATEMMQYTAFTYASSWMFANNLITLREYIQYTEAYYEQYDGPLI